MFAITEIKSKEEDPRIRARRIFLQEHKYSGHDIEEGIKNYKAKLDFEAKGISDIEPMGRGRSGGIYSAIFHKQTIILKAFTKIGDDTPAAAEEAFLTEKTLTSSDSKLSSTRFIKHLFVCDLPTNALLGPSAPAIAFPYFSQGSLDLLKMEEFSWDRRIDIVKQAAEGLVNMHFLNLVYCDFKPANILVDMHFKIKLADLEMVKSEEDILKELEERAKINKYAALNFTKGTQCYFAPELFQACSRVYNTKQSDVFSFGMFLLQTVLGTEVFNKTFDLPDYTICRENQKKDCYGRSPWRKLILNELNTIKTKTPPDFWNLMYDCLRTNPTKRPTMQQALERLEKLSKQIELFPSKQNSFVKDVCVTVSARMGFMLFGPGAAINAALGLFSSESIECMKEIIDEVSSSRRPG